jgi:hypothetical protein
MPEHSRNVKLWDDLRAPASAINPPGAVSDPDIDTTIGGLLFAASGTEIVYLQMQFPHTWAEETYIVPHVHWQKTTSAAGDVMWQLEYRWAPINEVMDAAWTTLTASNAVDGTTDTDEANKHLITSFGRVETAGKQVSDMLIIRLARLGDDAGDTYGADARLLEFDIHYQVNSLGSDYEFVKERD